MDGDRWGLIERIRQLELFDDGFYFDQIVDILDLSLLSELTLIEHYLEVGRSGRLPGHPDSAVADRLIALTEEWAGSEPDPRGRGAAAPEAPVLFVLHDLAATETRAFLLPFLVWLRANAPSLTFEVLVTIRESQLGDQGDGAIAARDALKRMAEIHWMDETSGRPGNRDRISAGYYSLHYVNALESIRDDSLWESLTTPTLLRVHGLDVSLERILGPDRRAAMFAADVQFAAPSAAVSDMLQRAGVAPDRIHGIAPFVATAEPFDDYAHRRLVRDALGIPREALIVLLVGSIDWRHGAYLLSGVARSLKNMRDASGLPYFVWLGDARDARAAPQLVRELALLDIEDRLKLFDRPEDIAPYCAAADVFLSPSVEEAFPLAIIEAGAAGLPAIAFDSSGGAEFIEADHGGLVVPLLDTVAMASALNLLVNDLGLRLALGEQARATAGRFSLEAAAPAFRDLISRLRERAQPLQA